MTIGLILECGPNGPDAKVHDHLVRMLVPGESPSIMTLDTKPRLLRECGRVARQLLEDGCAPVLIIWDLYPAWRERGDKPCRKWDRTAILDSLRQHEVDPANVGLVCITAELESWLLADGRALSRFLSTDAHRVRVRDTKHADRPTNPKDRLIRLFTTHRKPRYSDLLHAGKIAEQISDSSRLEGIAAFRRFKRFLLPGA
jgi:hypothetical protein